VPELLAVELTGDRFVDALTRAWSAGDAVLPLDPRLPRPAQLQLLDELRPSWVLDASGTGHRRAGGRPLEPGDALVVATSGTTGRPKGVVLTHAAVTASAQATSTRLGVDPSRDTWLACLPVAHVGGLSVITRALVTGTSLVALDAFDAAAVEDAARRVDGMFVSLVATALSRIDPRRFRTIVLGGGPPPPAMPPNAVVTYGLTETGSGVVYDGLPLDGVEVRIGANEAIELRGPMLGRAYRQAGADMTLTGAGDWFVTGDAGVIENGRLVVLGRLDDVIVTGGEKVWPASVERVLRGHDGVADVAVTGVLDPEWGERVVAVVVPDPTRAPLVLDELRDLVKQTLPPWAAPRQLVLVDALPRTGLGKVQRVALPDLVPSAP
jgi:o-succinylbenzoate---CoA ligase